MKLSAIVVAFLLPFPFSNAVAQSVNDAQIASIVVTAKHHPEEADFAYICTFHPTMKAMLRVE